jgi:hypothetical protein
MLYHKIEERIPEIISFWYHWSLHAFSKRSLERMLATLQVLTPCTVVLGQFRKLSQNRIMYEELSNWHASPQIKEDEIGGACSMHGRHDKCTQCFGWKN